MPFPWVQERNESNGGTSDRTRLQRYFGPIHLPLRNGLLKRLSINNYTNNVNIKVQLSQFLTSKHKVTLEGLTCLNNPPVSQTFWPWLRFFHVYRNEKWTSEGRHYCELETDYSDRHLVIFSADLSPVHACQSTPPIFVVCRFQLLLLLLGLLNVCLPDWLTD